MAEKSFFASVQDIKGPFWVANILEAGERLAYFGIRAILPLMMVSSGLGGLGLNNAHKGVIFGVWAIIQCIVPMISGGFTESFGYKKTLLTAFIINLMGYMMLAKLTAISALFSADPNVINTQLNFTLMLIAGCTIGLGTAIFKPPVQGVVAKSLNASNSGIGFGIFYWVVNVGGFIAPFAASMLRGSDAAPTWSYVFYGAAMVTVINIIVALALFKEPERAKDATNERPKAMKVLVDTLKVLGNDRPMLFFLLIVSGFWLMFMQLWDLLPNFLDEWVDRRDVGGFLLNYLGDGSFVRSITEPNGAVKPEILINIDSLTILIFVIPLSALFARYRMMTALIIGMVVSVIGFVLSGLTSMGAIVALAIFIFAIGEIICSPKFSEYIGMTAPADKKAIYMGFSNIPFAIGWAFGNFLSGALYELISSKTVLARRWLVDNAGGSADALADVKLPELMQLMQDKLSSGGAPVDVFQANEVLWNAYNPWLIWVYLGLIGVASMVGMIVFYFRSGMYAKDVAKSKLDAEARAIAEVEAEAEAE